LESVLLVEVLRERPVKSLEGPPLHRVRG
jgi:hypothetical protein